MSNREQHSVTTGLSPTRLIRASRQVLRSKAKYDSLKDSGAAFIDGSQTSQAKVMPKADSDGLKHIIAMSLIDPGEVQQQSGISDNEKAMIAANEVIQHFVEMVHGKRETGFLAYFQLDDTFHSMQHAYFLNEISKIDGIELLGRADHQVVNPNGLTSCDDKIVAHLGSNHLKATLYSSGTIPVGQEVVSNDWGIQYYVEPEYR